MVCRPSVAYLSVFKKTKFYQNTAMLTYLQSVDAFIHGRVEQLQQRLYIRPTKPKTFAIWHFKEKNYLTFTVCHTQELNKIYTESLWNHWVFQISSLRTYTPLKRLLQRQRILLLNKRTIVLSYFKCSPNNPAYLVCYSFLQFAAAAAKLLQSCPTLRPHRRQPTRLCRPWDSPGKNTGMGCHFLLQCRKVKSESDVAQLCLTPGDPMDCSPPSSSIQGIFQARVLEWGAIAFSILQFNTL